MNLNKIIKESFEEANEEMKMLEKTVDGEIDSLVDDSDSDEDEKEVDDNYYSPSDEDSKDEEELDKIEKGPEKVSNVTVNLKTMEYELAELKKQLKIMASSYKDKKPAKDSEEYKDYVNKYKELNSKISKLESEIEDELESGIDEFSSLKEIFQKKAGITKR